MQLRFPLSALPVAAFLAVALFGVAPAVAQPAGYYTATAVTAPGKTSVITRSTAWNCTGDTCVAAKAPERDAILCALVVRQVGPLSAFTVAGTAYDADALAKCNARAK